MCRPVDSCPKSVLKARSVAPASPRTREHAPSRSSSSMQHPSHLALHIAFALSIAATWTCDRSSGCKLLRSPSTG